MTRTLQSSAVTCNSVSGANPSKLCCRAVRLKTFCVSTGCQLLSTVCQLFVREQTHQSSVMCGCTRNGATCEIARIKKKQRVKSSRWKPAGGSQLFCVLSIDVVANRQQPVGGSRKPAGESQQVEDGCQQATASRRERTDKLTRESRKPAGASQQVEGGCQQATASQQARDRTDKLDRCGSQQATASRREKEASRWKPAGGRWKPAGGCPRRRLTTTTATTTPTTTTVITATTTADIRCPACSSFR